MRCLFFVASFVFHVIASVSDNKFTVLSYLDLIQEGNITDALLLADDNITVTWRGSTALFDSHPSPWVGKSNVSVNFYHTYNSLLRSSSFDGVTIVAATESIVIVQFMQYLEFIQYPWGTNLSTLQIFKFTPSLNSTTNSSLISEIEMILDSADLLYSHCFDSSKNYSNMLMVCDSNKVSGVPRTSDIRGVKPLPTPLNSNVTLNKEKVTSYLQRLSVGDFERAFTYLCENVSFTWHGSTRNFPSMGGTWTNKTQLQSFFGSVGKIFDMTKFSFDDVIIVAADNNSVFVQFVEHNTALWTSTQYNEQNSVIYTFGDDGIIVDVEVYLDTSAVLNSELCMTGHDKVQCTQDVCVSTMTFLNLLAQGNLNASFDFMGDSMWLIWPGTHIPGMSGEFSGKAGAESFFINKYTIFENITMSDFKILMSPGSLCVVEFRETGVAKQTKRAYDLTSTWSIAGGHTFERLVILVDSMTIFTALQCSANLTSPILECDENDLPVTPRTNDKRPPRPLPTSLNHNITLNSEVLEQFLIQIANHTFLLDDFLLEESSLTYQASLSAFPAIGGTWAGKTKITEFFIVRNHTFAINLAIDMYDMAFYNNIIVIALSEQWTTRKTNVSFWNAPILIVTFGPAGKIADLEIWEDSVAPMWSLLCKNATGSQMKCHAGAAPIPIKRQSIWKEYEALILVGGVTILILLLFGSAYYCRLRRKRSELQSGLLNSQMD